MAIDTTNGTALVRARDNQTVQLQSKNLDTMSVAKMLAESGFFGEVRQQGQALAKILAGQELGMGPIASLMGVYFANGKVTYSANIMAASIKRSGVYTFRVKRMDNDGCVLAFFERGELVGESSFTIQDATRAGLMSGNGKGNWEKYPRNMCFARAMSNGAKWYCPDVFGGITPYTPDELGAQVQMGEDGEMVPIKVEVIEPAQQPAELPDRETMVRWFRYLQTEAANRGHERRDAILKFVPEDMADDKLAKNYGTLRRWFPDVTDDVLLGWDDEAADLALNEGHP